MERLTFEGNFCDIAQCRELPCPYNGACSQRKVWERLAAYEDTGLTPERCAEFARADAEGRYIVMRDAEQEGVARLRELAEAAADVAPVVHARWIRPHWRNSNYCCDCSECGGEAMHRDYQWDKNGIYPICPNCGAKMME